MSTTAPSFNSPAYTGTTSNTGATGGSSKSAATLGQADFMKLLIAQLKNQDPSHPMDNTQFVSQLATFSALQQQTTMTQTLQQATAVGLIGMNVQDRYGNKGVVQSVSNDATNGLQLTINTTQTKKDGTTSTVPVQIKYPDIINVTPNSASSSTGGK